MIKYNYIIFICIILGCSPAVSGQTLPNFPYSSLGVGEFDYHAQGMLSGMGYGVSAIRSRYYLNNANPASYSALQDKMVVGELSTTGRSANIRSQGSSGSSSDFNVSRFAVGIKVNKFWGSSVGLLPLSTVMYQIVSPRTLYSTSQKINTIYEGNGGLHVFYWGNGIRIGRHLSLGARLNYTFGSINRKEKIGYDVNTTLLSSTKQTFLRNINFSYGLQYFGKITEKLDMTIALKYRHQRDLKASYTMNVISGDDTLTSKEPDDNYFTIPSQYRAGIAFTYADRLTIDLDYIFENWKSLSIKNDNVTLVDSHSYGLGFQWKPGTGGKKFRNTLAQRLLFEAGMCYSRSYMEISGRPVSDVSFSFGGGLSNKGGNISLCMGLAIGRKGTTNSDLINENYTNLYCTLILRNIWFLRNRYN